MMNALPSDQSLLCIQSRSRWWAFGVVLALFVCLPLASMGQPGSGEDARHSAVASTTDVGEVSEILTCQDCAGFKRTNPFFGTSNTAVSVVLFLVFILTLYLLSVAWFKGTISRGGSIVGSFVVAIGSFLMLGVLMAWVCFQQFTWNACWCKGLPVPTDGMPPVLSTGRALKQVNAVYWAIAFGAAIVIVVAIRLMVHKPAGPKATGGAKE